MELAHANGVDGQFFCLVIPLFLIFAIGCFILSAKRSNSIIEKWAIKSGFTVLSAKQCFLRTGPFFLRSTRGQTIYRITVQDAAGNIRAGYARCGGFLAGIWSDAITVEWDA